MTFLNVRHVRTILLSRKTVRFFKKCFFFFFFFFPPAARVDTTCHNGNDVFQPGDVWQAGCSTCTCLEGDRISCVLPSCPLLDCNETTIATDECCPVCDSSGDVGPIVSTSTTLRVFPLNCTSAAGHVYQDGASWAEAECNNCVCNGGNALCSQPSCYLGNCTTFVTHPGACCPVCIGKLAALSNQLCFDLNQNKGNMWVP